MTHIIANTDLFGSLKDRVVVITGGAAGIGRSTVEQFASYGAKVLVGDVNDALGNELAAQLGPSVSFQHCDAASYQDQLNLFAFAKVQYGAVDIAVANAGVVSHQSLFATDSDWTVEPSMREIDINLIGAIYTARIANGYFRQRPGGGDIILTSSISGFKETPGLATYTASKHGVVGLVRGLHLSAIGEDVRVNVICPWMTKTSMVKGFERQWCDAHLPTNEASDVARAILICASANRSIGKVQSKESTNGSSPQHTNASLPFAGKILWVGGGEVYEIEDRLQALEPQWLGEENSRVLARGQKFLSQDMQDWSAPKAVGKGEVEANGHSYRFESAQ